MIVLEVKEIKDKLKEVLTKKRYEHTLGVAYTAMCMAMAHDADIDKANIAGLLHDNAKCMSDEKLLQKCKKHGLMITDIEKTHPYLLHAKLGAFYAEYKYGIDDEEIKNAILYHTTGKPDMTMLEKIIYIADYIEPSRNKALNLKEIRKLAFTDIDECVYKISKDTIEYLQKDSDSIDMTTVETYRYYDELICNRRNYDGC